MTLDGRIALVTGGGRGLGRAVALGLGRAGARVAVTGRSRAALDDVVAELDREGVAGCVAREMDVADGESIATAVADLARLLGRVDILVNNAGIAESAPIGRTDLALWQRHLDINATAPYLLTRALLPGMLERRWGRVINIASTAGLGGAPYISAYAASKHALVGLTRAVAAEVAGGGVTVNAVCPGYAATDLVWRGARRIQERTGKSFEEAVAAMAALNPSGRLVEPDEVAASVVALCADTAASRTGETIVIG